MKSTLTAFGLRATPVLVALVLFTLILQASGFPGLQVVAALFQGSLGSLYALEQTLRWSLPLIVLGLGAVLSFRSGYFNIGGLGQFYLGAIGATAVATHSETLPPLLATTCSILAAILLGALWSLIPGILRVILGADEVITTIMANFIAELLLLYLVAGPMKNPLSPQAAASAPIPAAVRISDGGGLSIITVGSVVICVVAVFILVRRTPYGILSGMAGRNSVVLRWQGIGIRKIGLMTFALAGALGGFAGALEVLGPAGKLVSGMSPQVANTAMLIALVAGTAVLGSVGAAVFFGALAAGSLFLPIVVAVPASAVSVLNGVIALLVTARWKARRLRRAPSRREGTRTTGNHDGLVPVTAGKEGN